MRKLVIWSCLLLTGSGLFLTAAHFWEWERFTAVALGHIWLGFFFIVIFPMYSWDHIRGHASRLREGSWLTLSGILQLASGLGLILTGLILLLWGADSFDLPRELHIGLTVLLSLALLTHFRAPK